MDVRASHPDVDRSPSHGSGYARHIGRIGALAVTLGVGAAVATSLGAGTAWAEDSGSAGASSGSDSSTATSTSDRTRRTGADTAKRPAAAPRQTTRAGTQTGTRVSRDSKVTAATSRTARPSVGAALKPRSTALSVRAASAPNRVSTADRAPAPQAQPTATVISAPRSTLDTTPTDAETVSAPELSTAAASVEVAEAVAAPSSSTATGDTAPADSPALWALLAWTRRASTEQIQTDETAPTGPVTTSEHVDIPEGAKEVTEVSGVTAGAEGTTAVGSVGSVDGGEDTAVGVVEPLLPGQTITVQLAPDADGEYRIDLDDFVAPLVGVAMPFTLLVPPSHGTVTLSLDDNTLTYQPVPGHTGPDTFVVGYHTLLGLLMSQIVFEVPAAVADETPWTDPYGYGVQMGGTVAGDVMQYSGGGDGPLSAAVTGGPEYGTVEMDPAGYFYYTPPAGFIGIDTFSYTVTDADGDQASGTVVIYVSPKPPVATDDAVTVKAGDKVAIYVLQNDEYPDGELKIDLADKPIYGTVEYDPYTRTFTYTAGAGADSDTFSYAITDGYGQRSTATVTIKIEGTTTGAADDSAAVAVGGTASIDVLSNDQYAGSTVKVGVVTQPRYGKVEWDDGTRTFIYTAGNSAPRDADTFTYSITDGSGVTSTATVTVKIDGKPAGPVANNDHATTPNTTSVVIDILDNDHAPGEKPPTIRIDSPPRSGKAELVGNALHYTPDPGFVGTVTIGYSITDPAGLQSTATVTVVVTGKEQTIDRHFTAGQGTTLHVPGGQGVLSDPSHQGWTASMAEQAAGGSVELNPDGTFTYTPDPGFLGEDRFIVYISDGKTESKVYVYVSVTEAYVEPGQPQPVVQPVGFTSSALALGGGRATAECTDYYWPEIVDPDTIWPTCTLLYTRDSFNQVR